MYYDDDHFSQYGTRLRRDEGAQLFRVRWYVPGPLRTLKLVYVSPHLATRFRAPTLCRYGPPKIPAPTTNIFVERKTHHEKWTGEESVKERFGRSWWHPRRASDSRVAVHKLFESPHGTFVIATDFPLSKLPRFLSNDPNVVRIHFSHMVDDGELTAAKAEERAAFACEVQPGIARLKPKVLVGHLHRCSKGR